MSKYEFDGEKVKKLYGAMQKLGYQQSLGEFEKGFYGKDNYQKRKAVYDAMTEAGADLGGSYEDFMGRMRATSANKPTSKAPNTHISEQLWAQKSKEAKRAAAVLDGGFDALTRAAEVSSDENFRKNPLNKLVSERVEDPKSKRLVTKPKKYSVPESDVREGGSMVRMVDAYKTVDGKAVSIPSAATSTQGNENQDEDFATQYISGKIDRKEYKKKAKAKDGEAAIANFQSTMEGDEEFLYRTDKRYKEYRDKILNGDGDIDELSPETKAWYLERVEARIKDAEERQEKYLSVINSYEHQKNLEENNNDFWRNFGQVRGGIGAAGREQVKAMLRETDYTEEMDLANAGLGATESELTDLHALRDMLKGKDVGFFRRVKDFFGQRNNLTFGFQEAADNATLIANKNSKSPLLSSAAESRAKESEAATMYSRSANLRAKAGSVTAEMLPFVIEMASAGSMTSVAGKAAHKAVYSLGTRMLKSAALKGMEEGLLKATGTAALKVGTRGLSWIAHGLTAGALQTVTAGAGETAANITGRMVGQGAKQEDGSYAFEGGEGAVGAVLHGFTSQLIENATEFMGGGLGYGVGKVASKLTKPLAKVGLGGVTDFFGRIAASPISKATSKTLSKFQIQGIPEEIGEEYLGWAGHSMAGDGDAEWSDFADFQKHKELWATMALSVGAMGAFAASGHVPSLLKRRGRSLKMADRAAAGAFSDEEKWNALRDKLDGTDNNNVLRSLYDNVMQDKSLNGRERKAAMLYAGNLLAYRGANLGAIAGKRLALEQKRSNAEDARRAALVEGTASDDAERIDEHELDGDDVVSSAFRQGYEETSAANAYMWAKTLEEQEGHAMEVLGLSEKELNEKFSPQNAGETLNEIRGAKEGIYTEEQKKAAFDYANTRAAYEGVVERTQDDIDSEIAYRHAIVDRQTNIDFGRLHPVKLFTSEKNKWDDAFLVSGRLAFEFNDKGESVVSTRLSDPTLVVSDAAGRTHMVSPSEFADAEDAIDVDEYKNTLAEHIRQEMEERKYAEMLKAAEEAQANEVEEGEAEVPTVEGESTSEEEKETPKVNEDREQSSVFGGSFNVGDKFSTEDGEFEVVQLTEGEAPIVQNVETGQQYRPNSEEELRAAVLSYIPAFIDGKENTNRIIGYWRVSQSPVAPQNEAQQEEDTASENKSVDEEQEGFTEDSDSIPSGSQSENTQEESNISLEEVQSALDKGEIAGVTPQMAHDALYNDPDLETEEVDAIVENSRSASQANLAKLQKTEIKPRKNESVIAFKKRKAAHAGALAHAEELVRFWEDVQEHRRNLGAQAMQEEENAKQHREAEAAERAKEQAENGLAVAPSWANAEKVVGRPGEFITPNGLRVKGHYVLVESGAAVPSHDARHGFKQSEGFPTDEKGHTLNDRDYERDLDAQRVQREIARNYDARAAQQPVVVSPEGFVLSGNGRTMSGDLAAMENTDGSYNSYVREYAEMWGFTSEQVGKLEHPRIVFVSDNPLPLTTETFAAFNAQDTKTQSRTEKAVKMGKAVSDEDFAKILRIVTDGHETLADFYGNMSGVSEVINLLETSGVITQQDRANLFDGDALSDEGRNLLESVLLGKAFEANPDVVRQLSEVRSLRTSVLNALFYIVENERLNEEFRLGDELSRAINFVYHARKGGSYSFGDKVRTFAQQTELFESTTDVSLEGATVLLLADALNDKRTTLIKSIFKSYNERAEDAGRGQMSLFGDALPSRETLIKETLALLGVDIKDYVPSNQVERSNQATNEQQQEPKQQQQPEAGTSEPTSEQGAEGKTETELPSGSVSTSGRGNEGVSTEEEGAKPSDKNAKPSEKSTEKGEKTEGIEVDASAEKESVPLKEEEGINDSSRGGSLQDEKEKDKADNKLTTRQRVTKAKERGGREWIDSLRTTTDSHYLRLATDVGYISAPEAQAIIRNPHTKDDVLKLLLRKLEANYFDLYQTDVAEDMARRNLSAEDLQRLYDIAMKDPRAYRFYNALDAIAQNKNTPESVLDELYKRAIKEGRRLDKDGNYVDFGLRLAQNPSTSESHLRTLALTHGEDVAKNPSAPVDLLRVFATEKKSPYGSYYALRAAVAQNPSTPADLLLEILKTSDREEAAVEYAVKNPNLKGADLERAAELASNPSIFNNPNITDELLEKWASVKGETKAVKTFASLSQIELDKRRTSKAEEGKAHLTKSQRELLELVRNPNATAEELQRAYEGEYYDKDDAKQVKKAKELAKVREEVVRAVAAHPNAPSTILYEIYYSEGEEDPELQRIIESRKDDTIGEDILGSKPNGRIREQRVGTSDIVVGQTVFFRGTPWKVESVSPNGKLTITTEISGHVLRHENILPNWVRLSPVEEKQSDKELSHANNTVSEEQGDTKPARESNSEDLNSIESRDKDYADAVARGDIETAERMLAEEAERKGYSLDSPYQGESAFNGKAPFDSGYYENAEERKKAYDEGDYEGDWTLADELVHGVDMGSLVDFRLSDNELRRANDMTRESILNLREALRKARSGEKNITIKMYRSVPPGVKEREFRNGDWITPSRLYALDNAEIHEGYEGENQEGWNGGYRIIEQEVPIEDVWWDGNDVNEWGYDNGEREAYRNTENNRKAFSVTYDSEGNLIPLSKRFDETNSDARYSKGEEQRVSNENALAGVSPEQIELRDGLVDIMRNAGMDVSVSDAEGQRVLDLARGVQAASDEEEMTRAQEYTDAIARGELEAVENMRAVDSAEDGKLRVTSLSMDAEVPVVEVKPHMFKGNAKEAIRQIKTWAKANIARIYNNEETGGKGKIRISNTAIDKYLSLSSSKKSDSLGVHLSVLVELPQIIRFSVLIEQHSDVQKGVDGVRSVENGINKDVLISRLYGAIQMDGKTYRVKTTIRDNVNNTDTPRAHSYEVTKIELLDTSAETPQMEQVHPVKVSNNSITLAKLLNNVEFSYEKGRKITDELQKNAFQLRGEMAEVDVVREAREIERANAVFNAELDAFSEDNANRITFSLGRPSEVLRAAGVSDMPIKLYGNKLLKKIKKHGFDKVALRDLPRAVANPIAVFNNHKQEGNRAILTELHTEQGNVLVAIDLGKGADVDFNVVSSAFGKRQNGVVEWINRGQLTYVDKEKALNYLHLAAPITAASDNQKLSLAANIINGFKNPKLSGENLRQQRKNSITEEMQSIKTKAQSDGTFMLAPNGEPTNLTERQWLQVRTEAFKEWFGDWENDPENASKVVDENGEPRVVYHQTSEQFTKFDLSMSRVQSDVQGFFFSSGTEDWSAMGDEKMAVFLNLRNPVDKPIVDQSKNYAGVVARENLLKAGNDGAISFDEDESEEIEYLVLSPSQIKSATDNVGAFDKENDDIRFYRGQHGEVRGFAVGGRIYLDPKMASDETAIHEYTHLWADALRRVNPAEWGNVKDLLRGTPIWEETKRLYPELADDEDALADEVLAQFSGKHGAKRLAEAREKAMSEADGVFDKAKVASVFDNVRQALKRFWKGVADFLGLHFTSAEEVADKVLSDLLNGVNPNDVIANTKDSIREQRVDSDTREEMQRSVDELRVEVREGYEKAVKNWKYKIKEQWQDSMLALKTLQDELEKKGAKIEEWENAYWAENRMSSMNEEEMKAYTRDYFKPIVAAQIAASKALSQELIDKLNAMDAHLREFDKMNAEEKQRNAVDNYLMLKHGLERNRVLAMRDAIDAQWKNPSEASSVWRAYNEDAGNRENRRLLQEGKRSFEEFLQVDDAIRAHYAGEEYLKNREKDYSGLTSMTTEELTELKDVEKVALQLVKEAEDAAGAELSALWDKVNKATRESVEKLYKSGLLTPAAYSQMTTMFQWYVPLRGFAEETSDEVYDYVDQRNGNGMGAVLKGADGRKSKADSPIAHIGSMAERSVVQGNRNLMKQHFYRMILAHPNDLVSMGEIYLHHNEVTDEWEMMTPTFTPNATPEQIAEETRAFEERMQELVQQEPDNYLRLREHPDVPYRVLGSNLGEHQVLVKVLGRDKLLTVNGDPRVAQAVNGRFNPDAAQTLAGKSVRALNRVLAQMATQSNPEFIFRNMFRDRSYAMKASLVKDGARYWQRLERNWVAGLGQVIGLSKRYENGTLNINNELDKMFQEFMMNGGATGVTRLLNPEDYKGEITDIAKELQRGKYSVVKLTKLMKKYIEFFGSCSELITRFATYRTSREMGRSVARAVWDAKEISTNFNKKGAGNKALRKNDGLLVRTSGELASFFRNYIIFTNANIQGFHNQWQIAKKHPLRFALNFAVRGLFTGFLMTLANRFLVSAFGDDDDRYMDLPESARRSNLCFFVPGLGWVKFPLGFNYRSFYGLGGLMAERVFMPDESYESFMKSARSLVLDMLPVSIRDSEQPLWLNLVPSGVRPMAEVAVNEDWSGRPIVNEYTNENWPEYRRANNHTSPVSVYISEKLSDWTGGDEYSPGFVNLNPSQFEHIALGLLSGVGTLMGNTYETTANLIQGEELDTQHIPFLRDFLTRNNQPIHASAVKHNFYALKDEYEKTKVRVKGYEKEEADGKNDPESVARRVDFRKNSKEYKRYKVMAGAVRTENKIRKYMKEATTPEEVKKLEADLQKVMEDAINDVRAIK